MRRSAESVELTRIYVLPGGQRSGIGARLLGTALAEFADERLKRLTVVVEQENLVGRRFYEKMGFTDPLARHFLTWPFSLVMSLPRCMV